MLEFDLAHSGSDLRLIPAQEHPPGCGDRAAHQLRTEQEGHLQVAVGGILPDDGKLRTESGGVVKPISNYAEVHVEAHPSRIDFNEYESERLHQLDDRRESLVGDAMFVCWDAPPRPLCHVHMW